MSGLADNSFKFPEFWFYPPYFTLQPIKETQQKQKDLWRDLLLRYCKHHRIFIISTDEMDTFPPFSNPAINRSLSREARLTLLSHLVLQGTALWLDPKTQRQCLVLWRSIPEWADSIYTWAVGYGFKDSVMTLDELARGEEVKGSEVEGLHREVMVRALRHLEGQGKAKLFKGASEDEEGVKFF